MTCDHGMMLMSGFDDANVDAMHMVNMQANTRSVTVVDIDKGKFCICAASNHISTNQVVRNVHLAIEGRNYSLDLVILRSLG